LDGISALTVNGDAGEMGFTLQPIINETVAEIAALERTLATKWEFLFNFIGGGWNSEVAFTKEDAIEQALFNYGHPDTQTHLRVDTSTFRVSTPTDYKNQLSSFY
jgi:hypothetical protein